MSVRFTSLALTSMYLFLGSVPARASVSLKLRCDKAQTYCLVENKRLVVGDSVGFINDNQELLASGEVTEMNRSERRITITKKLANITANSKIIRLADSSADAEYTGFSKTNAGELPEYSEPKEYSVGADLGFARTNLDEKAPVFFGEILGRWHRYTPIDLTARIQVAKASGQTTNAEASADDVSYDLTSFAGLAGVAYRLVDQNKMIVRSEVQGGLAYSTMQLDTDVSSASSLKRIGSASVAPIIRTGVDASYELSSGFKPELGACFYKINEATFSAVTLGFSIAR